MKKKKTIKREKVTKGDYLFLAILVISIIFSTVMIHCAKVVDVAEYYINMKDVIKERDFLDGKIEAAKGYKDDRESGKDMHTIGSIFDIDDDTPYEDSIAYIYNYIDAKTINVYVKRILLFAFVSMVIIVLSLYTILNKRKYILLFLLEIIGIIICEIFSKSMLFTLSFAYLPIIGIAYYFYYNKLRASK